MIAVARIGFTGFADADGYDGPESALGDVLRRLEEEGSTVLSVSVLRSTRAHERYEAFIIYRQPNVLVVRGSRPLEHLSRVLSIREGVAELSCGHTVRFGITPKIDESVQCPACKQGPHTAAEGMS